MPVIRNDPIQLIEVSEDVYQLVEQTTEVQLVTIGIQGPQGAQGPAGPPGPSGQSLPDQSGHSGEFLTTDGTNPSWATVPNPDLTPYARKDTANTFTALQTVKQTGTNATIQEWQDTSGNLRLRITTAGDRPVIQFGDTASDQGLSIRNNVGTEVFRIQDNGGIFASQYTTNSGLSVNGLKIVRGSGSLGLYFGEAGQPSLQVETPLSVSYTSSFAITGRASQTFDLQQWQSSTGSVLARITAAGGVIVSGAVTGDATLGSANVRMGVGSTPRLILDGGSTGAVTQFDNNSGTFRILNSNAAIFTSSTGTVGTSSLYASPVTNVAFNIPIQNASHVGLVINGAASQTAAYTEWKDSTGTTQATIKPYATTDYNGNAVTLAQLEMRQANGSSNAFIRPWVGRGLEIVTGGVANELKVGGLIRTDSGISLSTSSAGASFRSGTQGPGLYRSSSGAVCAIAITDQSHGSGTNAWRVSANNAGTDVEVVYFAHSMIECKRAIKSAELADSAAPNGTLYYSTTAGKLVFKDSTGTVNNLY